jgi:hypothetical protein
VWHAAFGPSLLIFVIAGAHEPELTVGARTPRRTFYCTHDRTGTPVRLTSTKTPCEFPGCPGLNALSSGVINQWLGSRFEQMFQKSLKFSGVCEQPSNSCRSGPLRFRGLDSNIQYILCCHVHQQAGLQYMFRLLQIHTVLYVVKQNRLQCLVGKFNVLAPPTVTLIGSTREYPTIPANTKVVADGISQLSNSRDRYRS